MGPEEGFSRWETGTEGGAGREGLCEGDSVPTRQPDAVPAPAGPGRRGIVYNPIALTRNFPRLPNLCVD
jgi:hypothetical protein